MSFDPSFLDFCLSCDRHTVDGPYCSQACRLADLEKSGSSAAYPASPSTPAFTYPTASPWGSSASVNTTHNTGSGASNGVHLPPALDFSAYRFASPTYTTTHVISPSHTHDPHTKTTNPSPAPQPFSNLSRSSSVSSSVSTASTSHIPSFLSMTSSQPSFHPSTTHATFGFSSSSSSRPTQSLSFISESAQQELRHYESLFDQSRYRQRRASGSGSFS